MRWDSLTSAADANKHNSTLAACSENRAKFTPAPSQMAPRGYGRPGQTRMVEASVSWMCPVSQRLWYGANGVPARCGETVSKRRTGFQPVQKPDGLETRPTSF